MRGFVSNLASDSLLGIGLNGRPTARIVESWEWSPDRLELTLRLRPNLRFHDGTPVDAVLFKKSLEQTLKNPRQVGSAVSYRSIKALELRDNNLVVILSRPEAFLLTDLANTVLSHPNNPDIGLGPYRIIQREPKARLAAFENYYRARPNIDAVEVHGFEEQRSSWAALMRGEIDAVNEVAPGAVDFVEAKGQTAVRTYSFTRPYFMYVVFNLRNPILKNRLVRQALSYAVDRQAVIDSGLNRQGIIAEGPIWPFHWAYSTAHKTYSHNSEVATLRLDSAGFELKKETTQGQMPKRFAFTCLTLRDARFEKIAMVLQKQLYEIGVDMQIESVPMQALTPRLEKGQFDAVLIERSSGRSLAWTYLSFHSTFMPLGYSAADDVLDRLRRSPDETDTRSGVSELQQILHDDPPALFLAWPQVARGVSAKFVVPEDKSPVRDEIGRDVMSSLWQWKPAEAAK